ncbi:MAG: hypothetical protein EP329_24790 [Deltaproteobacteria bacterium]|nr:MAG: hypothetical protein EP329_24790 [Deltaproteobacteria bacterium]
MSAGLLGALAAALLVASPPPEAVDAAVDGWTAPLEVSGEVDGVAASTRVLVYLPHGYAASAPERRWPLVLALHGWKHTPEQYRDEGGLAALADRHGVVVALPAMGTTVYETRYYPESRRKWGAVPGARFVAEEVLPAVQARFRVAEDRAHTAVIGYSTGGRGAVLLAEAYPDRFAFAGSLSGTFDLMRLAPKSGEYKIHAVVYGPRAKHRDRWERDNVVSPARLAGLRDTAVYAAHGADDTVVLPDQLDALRDALGADARATFALVPGHGHTWAFWRGQAAPLFAALADALGLASAADETRKGGRPP